ncbi:TPA: hypothetical protein N0F65_009588 [Lagenidium giganteum]|uniref:Nucleolar protein 14 n=2 Tax=Lagenidium giganteum TaxID=4803 RepID=A0AAV2YIV8_9STRA|nr:TPA: hypothetical protein N0F65_009588 [Lagenidium giganteum]
MVFRTKAGSKAGKGKGGGAKSSKKVAGNGSANGNGVAKLRALNPFDVRSNAKTKYEVLGKRVKGQARNVAIARSQAEEKRKKTLAAQFQARNKVNAFKDKRLGEQDPTMSLEDKMMARFQTERKRKMRNAQAFALNDSDDEDQEELFLTHKGAKIDDYDSLNQDAFDAEEGEDDEHSRQMDREIVEKLHFGGGSGAAAEGGEGEHKKSHKEIMQEVMAKSKLYKAERQKNKMAQEDLTEDLDKGFSDILGLLDFRPRKGEAGHKEEKPQMDEFDRLTRELTFEAKAKATERRMTPEELDKREHERLEELEKKRVARMNGEDVDSDNEGDRKGKGKKKAPQMIIMPPTDDSLTANYEVDRRFGGDREQGDDDDEVEGGDEDGDDVDEEEEGDDDDDEEDGDEEGSDAEEEDADEAEDAEAESEEDPEEDEATRKARKRQKQQAAAEELPFVFPCPESPEDLTALFQEHAKGSPEKRDLIVERILKYYSPRLSVDNQNKMKTFLAILVRQFLKWGNQYAVHKTDLDSLSKHLFTLCQSIPDTAGIIFREFLINLYKRTHSTKNNTRWPNLGELLLFRVLIHIFPSSDLRHNVISPMETLVGDCLANGTFKTSLEATSAVFACSLSLQTTLEKKRFMPEVLFCLKKLLRSFIAVSGAEKQHWLHDDLMQSIQNGADDVLEPLNLAAASSTSAAAVLNGALGVVEVVIESYAHLPSFDELLHPVYLLLHEIARSCFDGKQARINGLIAHIHEALEKCWADRRPLRLQTFAPSVLPSFMPKFDENYTVRKDKTLDREKAQTKQLQRQVKRARKNAARELRRDAEFLAREKHKEESERLSEKRESQKEVRRWLEEQNATFNQQVKKGGHMLKGGGSGAGKKPPRIRG